MGLDMYLSRITYQKSDKSNQREEFAYWRKANQIHSWFVVNVQKGKDNCKEFWVPRDLLRELLDTIDKVMKDKTKAETLLPVSAGFFFGTTEYDDDYFAELKSTQKMLKKALATTEGEFYYQSSW